MVLERKCAGLVKTEFSTMGSCRRLRAGAPSSRERRPRTSVQCSRDRGVCWARPPRPTGPPACLCPKLLADPGGAGQRGDKICSLVYGVFQKEKKTAVIQAGQATGGAGPSPGPSLLVLWGPCAQGPAPGMLGAVP